MRLPAGEKGDGFYATQRYEAHDTVLSINPWRGLNQPIIYVNHSCRPNCISVKLDIIAVDRIESGTEITVDYTTLDFPCRPMSFQCLCRESNCKGEINT